ncbi:MAG: hypothetical protein D6725_02585 [Planctomycetota bacterium]|nr:MAG: hypothetical protein D6725_02585 [Planctomycetota bacterium]
MDGCRGWSEDSSFGGPEIRSAGDRTRDADGGGRGTRWANQPGAGREAVARWEADSGRVPVPPPTVGRVPGAATTVRRIAIVPQRSGEHNACGAFGAIVTASYNRGPVRGPAPLWGAAPRGTPTPWRSPKVFRVACGERVSGRFPFWLQ